MAALSKLFTLQLFFYHRSPWGHDVYNDNDPKSYKSKRVHRAEWRSVS